MKEDRAKHSILPPSKFGLIQITRQRVRPEMDIKTSEKCPSCHGTGEAQAPILLADEIERDLRHVLDEYNHKEIMIGVHPFVEAYLNRGWLNSIRKGWAKKYKRKIKVLPISSYTYLEYHFLDADGESILAE